MNLYFITNDNENVDADEDLFVIAGTPDEAVLIWRAYYMDGWQEEINQGWSEPTSLDGRFPSSVFLVPETRKKGALRWHTDIREVQVPTKEAALALGIT